MRWPLSENRFDCIRGQVRPLVLCVQLRERTHHIDGVITDLESFPRPKPGSILPSPYIDPLAV
jgi:hypothetical protein